MSVGYWSLQEFDAVSHFLRFVHFPEEFEAADDLADAARVLVAVSHAGMFVRGGESQEIAVFGEQDATLGDDVGKLLQVGSADQPGVGGGRYVYAESSEAAGNGTSDV